MTQPFPASKMEAEFDFLLCSV